MFPCRTSICPSIDNIRERNAVHSYIERLSRLASGIEETELYDPAGGDRPDHAEDSPPSPFELFVRRRESLAIKELRIRNQITGYKGFRNGVSSGEIYNQGQQVQVAGDIINSPLSKFLHPKYDEDWIAIFDAQAMANGLKLKISNNSKVDVDRENDKDIYSEDEAPILSNVEFPSDQLQQSKCLSLSNTKPTLPICGARHKKPLTDKKYPIRISYSTIGLVQQSKSENERNSMIHGLEHLFAPQLKRKGPINFESSCFQPKFGLTNKPMVSSNTVHETSSKLNVPPQFSELTVGHHEIFLEVLAIKAQMMKSENKEETDWLETFLETRKERYEVDFGGCPTRTPPGFVYPPSGMRTLEYFFGALQNYVQESAAESISRSSLQPMLVYDSSVEGSDSYVHKKIPYMLKYWLADRGESFPDEPQNEVEKMEGRQEIDDFELIGFTISTNGSEVSEHEEYYEDITSEDEDEQNRGDLVVVAFDDASEPDSSSNPSEDSDYSEDDEDDEDEWRPSFIIIDLLLVINEQLEQPFDPIWLRRFELALSAYELLRSLNL